MSDGEQFPNPDDEQTTQSGLPPEQPGSSPKNETPPTPPLANLRPVAPPRELRPTAQPKLDPPDAFDPDSFANFISTVTTEIPTTKSFEPRSWVDDDETSDQPIQAWSSEQTSQATSLPIQPTTPTADPSSSHQGTHPPAQAPTPTPDPSPSHQTAPPAASQDMAHKWMPSPPQQITPTQPSPSPDPGLDNLDDLDEKQDENATKQVGPPPAPDSLLRRTPTSAEMPPMPPPPPGPVAGTEPTAVGNAPLDTSVETHHQNSPSPFPPPMPPSADKFFPPVAAPETDRAPSIKPGSSIPPPLPAAPALSEFGSHPGVLAPVAQPQSSGAPFSLLTLTSSDLVLPLGALAVSLVAMMFTGIANYYEFYPQFGSEAFFRGLTGFWPALLIAATVAFALATTGISERAKLAFLVSAVLAAIPTGINYLQLVWSTLINDAGQVRGLFQTLFLSTGQTLVLCTLAAVVAYFGASKRDHAQLAMTIGLIGAPALGVLATPILWGSSPSRALLTELGFFDEVAVLVAGFSAELGVGLVLAATVNLLRPMNDYLRLIVALTSAATIGFVALHEIVSAIGDGDAQFIYDQDGSPRMAMALCAIALILSVLKVTPDRTGGSGSENQLKLAS